MERLVCSYCGIPFRTFGRVDVGPAYCCSGCAMAARLNITDEAFPITPQLIYNLSIAFGFFNQLLLLVLSIALVNEGKVDTAGWFAFASAVLGAVVFAVALVWQLRGGLLRRTDGIVFVCAGVFAVANVTLLFFSAMGAAAFAGIVSTGFAMLWQMRGVVRKWIGRVLSRSRNRENNVRR